jgi:tetratricopeptide (TPR) repeat protein
MKFINKACGGRKSVFAVTILTLVFSLLAVSSAEAQENLDALRKQAATLLEQDKYLEALPVLEKIAQADPQDGDTQFYLGFAILSKSLNTKDNAERKALRVRARNTFLKAKELGTRIRLVDALLGSIPPDGGEPKGFSENVEANEAMKAGESAFTQGKIDEALALYQKALKLDPKIYEAALFSGDMYMRKGDFPNAEIWYQKAIAIDPNRETAYRYSATPLMKQQKYDQARDRYIEAYITEPYSRFATFGISQWAEATGTPIGHPRIDVPEAENDADGKAKTTINVNPLADDGSMAWIAYVAAREVWRKEKFAKTFPAEKTYRHSLQEEADALRGVVKMVKTLKSKPKNLNPQIATLAKLDEEGLLEAYILLARPTEGIAQDHAAYLRQNRDKLRQYVVKYVIGSGK